MTEKLSPHLLNAHYEVVRMAGIMRNVNLPNFAAALDAIERDLRAVIGNEAADANLDRKKPFVRRTPKRRQCQPERRAYGPRRLTSRPKKQS